MVVASSAAATVHAARVRVIAAVGQQDGPGHARVRLRDRASGRGMQRLQNVSWQSLPLMERTIWLLVACAKL